MRQIVRKLRRCKVTYTSSHLKQCVRKDVSPGNNATGVVIKAYAESKQSRKRVKEG